MPTLTVQLEIAALKRKAHLLGVAIAAAELKRYEEQRNGKTIVVYRQAGQFASKDGSVAIAESESDLKQSVQDLRSYRQAQNAIDDRDVPEPVKDLMRSTIDDTITKTLGRVAAAQDRLTDAREAGARATQTRRRAEQAERNQQAIAAAKVALGTVLGAIGSAYTIAATLTAGSPQQLNENLKQLIQSDLQALNIGEKPDAVREVEKGKSQRFWKDVAYVADWISDFAAKQADAQTVKAAAGDSSAEELDPAQVEKWLKKAVSRFEKRLQAEGDIDFDLMMQILASRNFVNALLENPDVITER